MRGSVGEIVLELDASVCGGYDVTNALDDLGVSLDQTGGRGELKWLLDKVVS